MCKEFRFMQCLFCGRDLSLPIEKNKKDSDEVLFSFSGECNCASCRVEICFSDVEISFRKLNSDKEKGQKGNEGFFLISCPGCNTGKIKIFLGEVNEVRTSFKTLKEANENRHLGDRGIFEATILSPTSNCNECDEAWRVETDNQKLFFETKRDL